jgi:prophage tail gpP-like protein
MAFFPLAPDGKPDDRVRLELGDNELLICQSYEVSQHFLTQPAAFAVRVGDGRSIRELRERFPANTPYRLYIGDVLQQSGMTDGISVDDASGASVLSIRGRDSLAPLHDDIAIVDRGFGDITYKELVEACLRDAGIADYSLVFDNSANRRVQGGLGASGQTSAPKRPEGARVGVTVVADPTQDQTSAVVQNAREAALAEARRTGESITIDVRPGAQSIEEQLRQFALLAGVEQRAAKTSAKKLQIKLGDARYGFLNKELSRAGLFLFAGVDERVFILTEPNAKQKPTYRLQRQRGLDRNAVNVLTHRFKDETTRRHAEYVVYGRGSSDSKGREKVRGSFIDEEMIALGYTKKWGHEDQDAKSSAQCEFYARRACASARRESWELVFTVEGHTAVSLFGGGRAVWAIDTIVDVQDDELGIYGPHWIEAVDFRRGDKGTTTDLHLMRPEDLVFGEGEFLAPKIPKQRGGFRSRRRSGQ